MTEKRWKCSKEFGLETIRANQNGEIHNLLPEEYPSSITKDTASFLLSLGEGEERGEGANLP